MEFRLALLLVAALTIFGLSFADRDDDKEQTSRSGYNLRDRNRNQESDQENSRGHGYNLRDRNRKTDRDSEGGDRTYGNNRGSDRDSGSDRNRGSSYGQGSGSAWSQGSDRNRGNSYGSDRNYGNDRNQGSDRENGNDRNRGNGWNQGSDRNNGNDRNQGSSWGQGSGSDRNQGSSWGNGNDRNRETGSNNGFSTNQGSYGGSGSYGGGSNDRDRETGSSNIFNSNQGYYGNSGQGGDRNQGNDRDQSNKSPKDKVKFPGLNNKDVKEQLVRAYWPWIDEKFPKPVQSPVDISTLNAKKENLPDFNFENYWENRKEIVRLRNDGYTVQVTIADDVLEEDRPYINGGPLKDDYLFEGMHLHWGKTDGDGSEHTLNGKTFSTEMHIVHFKKEYGSLENAQRHYDGIAVVAFWGIATLWQEGVKLLPNSTLCRVRSNEHEDNYSHVAARGGDNRDLAGFINDLERVRKCNSSTVMPVQRTFECIKKIASARSPANRYYAYPGSLTTPPFSESVIWIVFPDAFQISSRQLNEFRQMRSCENKALIRKNDRELQPFNNRPVIYAY